jgi:hypothetical protein
MSDLDMAHFTELRSRINRRLDELSTVHAETQKVQYPWLYGALGAVPASAMLICENPSLTGVSRAHVATVDGLPPDIEAQWWGGPRNPAATRLRVALHRLGLKSTPPAQKGGWRCYITNVVKEANVAGDQRKLTRAERDGQAVEWADILRWELECVQPEHVFAVGGEAHRLLRFLQRQGLTPRRPIHPVRHYSARGSHAATLAAIEAGIGEVLNPE